MAVGQARRLEYEQVRLAAAFGRPMGAECLTWSPYSSKQTDRFAESQDHRADCEDARLQLKITSGIICRTIRSTRMCRDE